MTRWRDTVARTGALALLLAAVALATYPGVLAGGTLLPVDWLYEAYYPWHALDPGVVSANPRQNDAIVQLHPLDRFTRERLGEGEVPLWNPYLGAGVPHLATGFTRALYPPFWLTLPFGPEGGRNLEILLHLVMAGTFQLLYLRFMGCRWASAFLGGLAFAWSGALTVRTPLTYVLDTLVWVPAVLLGLEAVLRARAWGAPFLALATGMQLLAGSLPDVLSTWILAGLYLLVRCLQRPRPPGRTLVLVLAAVVLGAGVAAAQLAPQMELVGLSQRGHRTYEELRATGASWHSVLSLLSPFLAGAEFTRAPLLGATARVAPLYVGCVSLAFLPAAVRSGRGPLLALGLAGAGLLAVAAGTPALYLVYAAFPPVAGLRYVHTLAHVGAAVLATAAGWGAEAWLSEGDSGAPRASPVRPALGAAVLVTLALGGAGVGWVAANPTMADVWLQAGRALAFLAAPWLFLVARRRGWISPRALGAFLVLLSAAELSRSAARHNPVAHQAPVLPWTPALRAVASDPEPGRAIGVQPKQSGRFGPWVIGSNLFQAYGIADAGAYHSLLPARLVRYHTVMARMAEGATSADALAGGRSFFVTLEHYDFRATALARLMGIRYLFYRPSDEAPAAQGLRPAYQGEVDVYRFTGHLPRAFVAQAFEVEPDPERLLARLADPGFRPRQTVLLEERPSVPGGGGESSAMLASSRPESSTYEVTSAAGGLLVVTDAMYPGWTVRVNGRPAPLLRADYLFRAVAVPPGTSTVDMRYEPRSFRAGVAVSLISGVLVLALGLALARRAQGPTP